MDGLSKLLYGTLGGLVGLVALTEYLEPPKEERRRADAAYFAKQIAEAADTNRGLFCGAIAAGMPLDAPPYTREVYQGRYTPPIGRGYGATHKDPIPEKDMYGLPQDCASGLKPTDVIEVCSESIGVNVTTQQISRSLAGSGEEVRKALGCLK